jgi:nucleoside-diphosphate-sugar epimerase
MPPPPRSILVTGAGGFIARQLISSLAQAGASVIAATHTAMPASTIVGASRVIAQDVGPDTEWRPLLDDVDAVVHLAARVHKPEFANADAALHERVNHAGTARLAEQIAEAGRPMRLVFLSTIAVHARHESFVDENTAVSPESSYGRSKARAEQAIATFLAYGPSDWTILRPTIVYGPQCPGNMSRLARLLKKGVPLLFGAIHNQRSILYCGNVVNAIHTTLTHPAASRAMFCVADPSPISTPALVRELARALGVRPRLWNCPLALLRGAALSGDIAQRLIGIRMPLDSESLDRLTTSLVVSTAKLTSQLGWVAPYSTVAGLQAMGSQDRHSR